MTQHTPPTLEELDALAVVARSSLVVTKPESQHYDRKSARISPLDLAEALVGFANAEGGVIVVGIHSGLIEGVTPAQANALLRAPMDFAEPPVPVRSKQLECVDAAKATKYVVAFEVIADGRLYRTRGQDVFLRVGDSTKRLNAFDAQELAYEKASPPYDTTPVTAATTKDLERKAVAAYAKHLSKSADANQLLRARRLLVTTRKTEHPSVAALLIFGTAPQGHLPQARLRVISYRGNARGTGTGLNVDSSEEFDFRVPLQIDRARKYIAAQIPRVLRLDPATARFAQLPLVPAAVWEEAVVNAIAHRSYSLVGDHIRVEIFTDRMEVTSPGRLPGMVTVKNIRGNHFARNPLLARVLSELGYMRETAEGVERMFTSMATAGFPPPLLTEGPASFTVTLLFDSVYSNIAGALPSGSERLLHQLATTGRVTTGETEALTGRRKPAAIRLLKKLAAAGFVERVETNPRDPTGYWRVLPKRTQR